MADPALMDKKVSYFIPLMACLYNAECLCVNVNLYVHLVVSDPISHSYDSICDV